MFLFSSLGSQHAFTLVPFKLLKQVSVVPAAVLMSLFFGNTPSGGIKWGFLWLSTPKSKDYDGECVILIWVWVGERSNTVY